jgi:ankyrin repeat protein
MTITLLPFDSPFAPYENQATELLAGRRSGDADAIRIFHENYPQFLDEKIPWLPKRLSADEIKNAALDLPDAQLALARWYCFRDWPALEEYVGAVTDGDPVVFRFESAVEAVVNGDLAGLETLLREHPELAQARSVRETKFAPPVHRSTLLHYVAANGVEGYRQKTPKNAVDIAKALLEAGAEADAMADLYGSPCTTMTLLVSSCHPAEAGVQVELVNLLLDFGASAEENPPSKWGSPLMTALGFGYPKAAEALFRRGARVDSLPAAAGLGRTTEAAQLLAGADAESRHRALALGAQHGYAEIVRLLLDAGEDPNRYNPDGLHAHSTPLHQAALVAHEAVVKLLVDRGARLDIKDTIYHATSFDWAVHGGKKEIAEYLRAHGALSAEELGE